MIMVPTFTIFVLMAGLNGDDRVALVNLVVFSLVLLVCGFVIFSLVLIFFGDITFIPEVGTVNELSAFGVKFGQIYMGSDIPRVSSLTTNPNSFGLLTMLSFVGAKYLRSIKFLWFGGKGYFFVLVFVFLGFFLCLSRSSIISSFVGIVLFLFLSMRKFSNKVCFFLVVGGLAIALLLFISLSEVPILDDGRVSLDLNGREEVWSLAFSRIVDNPFLGIGMGAVDGYLSDAGSMLSSTHNAYINLILEAGVLGFLVFLLFVSFVFFVSLTNVWRAKSEDIFYFCVFLFVVFVSILLTQLVEGLLFQFSFFHFIFVFFAFSILFSDEKL